MNPLSFGREIRIGLTTAAAVAVLALALTQPAFARGRAPTNQHCALHSGLEAVDDSVDAPDAGELAPEWQLLPSDRGDFDCGDGTDPGIDPPIPNDPPTPTPTPLPPIPEPRGTVRLAARLVGAGQIERSAGRTAGLATNVAGPLASAGTPLSTPAGVPGAP